MADLVAHYDTTLKQLFRSGAGSTLGELTGKSVARWLDVELPRVQNPRVNLLGETTDGELQSTNAPDMPLRMSEYCLAILRKLGRFPRQALVYVGQESLTMPGELADRINCCGGTRWTSGMWMGTTC